MRLSASGGKRLLTGIHILLTYRCTYECDHCFLHCGPHRAGAFTIPQLGNLFDEIGRIGTIQTVYFEGGEPFLHYATLAKAYAWRAKQDYEAGIVTNAYWATSLEDARCCLRPFRDLELADLSISDDEFHDTGALQNPAAIAQSAAAELGIPCTRICIESHLAPHTLQTRTRARGSR